MSKFSHFITDFKKLVVPGAAQPVAPEVAEVESLVAEVESLVAATAVDAATAAARAHIKALTMNRPGSPFFADAMTPGELRQKRIQNRMAQIPPPRNPWLDPHGERRSIWERD